MTAKPFTGETLQQFIDRTILGLRRNSPGEILAEEILHGTRIPFEASYVYAPYVPKSGKVIKS